MSEEKSLGKLINTARKQLGLSQQELADKFDTAASRITVGRWEKDEQRPTIQNFEELIGILDLNEQESYALYYAGGKTPPERQNLPRENRFFTGREGYLEELRKLLEKHRVVALSGLGGIGKTRIALRYAHQHHPDIYSTALWVNAADTATLEAGFASLAKTLELPEKDEERLDRRIEAVKDWLKEYTNWLLILDNADELPIVEEYLPSKPHGHILLTTRWQFPDKLAKPLEIEPMGLEEGVFFLWRRSSKDGAEIKVVPPDIPKEASQIVAKLGGHALALEQAGAYIQETSTSFADYLKLYEENRRSLLDQYGALGDTPSDHPLTVAATFKISFARAGQIAPLAIYILYFCAFLQPDAIPEELFQPDESFTADIMAFNKGIAALQRYSLIKYNEQEKTYSLHRLVQEVLIDNMAPDTRKLFRENVVHALSATFPSVDWADWKYYEHLPAHALICATWTEDELTPTIEAVNLFRTAGNHLYAAGQYSEAETLYSRAFSILVQHLGAEHPSTATVLNELANLYTAQGKDIQAESLYLQNLAIQNMSSEALHPATALCLRHLSVLSLNHGKFDQSKSFLEQALAIQETHLGAEHVQTAKSLCMLAVLYYAQGEYAQADLLYWRTIRVWDKHGLAERDVQIPLDGSTLLKYEQVQHERVIPLFNRAFSVDVSIFESKHALGEALARIVADPAHKRKRHDEPPV